MTIYEIFRAGTAIAWSRGPGAGRRRNIRGHDMTQQAKVETVKQGEYVRRKATTTKTYIRGGYDRTAKRFELVDCDDVNRTVMVKRGTILCVGFTY